MRADARRRFVDISFFEASSGDADDCRLGDKVAEPTGRAWNQDFAGRHAHFLAIVAELSIRRFLDWL